MYKNKKFMTGKFTEECRNYLLQINGCDSATQTTSKTRNTKRTTN